MGKLIKIICGLFFILYCTNLYADPKSMAGYPWIKQQMPIWCGPLKVVNQALKNEGYVEVEIAFGRAKALPEGKIAYAVITYASIDTEGHILRTMETPAQQEKYILNMLFNYKVVETPTPKTN